MTRRRAFRVECRVVGVKVRSAGMFQTVKHVSRVEVRIQVLNEEMVSYARMKFIAIVERSLRASCDKRAVPSSGSLGRGFERSE